MIDQLEARGYIGAFDGSNARPVLRRDRAAGGSTTRSSTRMGTTDDDARTAATRRRAPTGGSTAPPGTRPPTRRPSLPERLYAARERKGVDLYRAERDTKIRARYLGALERGDYKELPGSGLHEGLPAQLRALPRAGPGRGPRPVAARARRRVREASAPVVPRPMAAPRQGLTFSPCIVVLP